MYVICYDKLLCMSLAILQKKKKVTFIWTIYSNQGLHNCLRVKIKHFLSTFQKFQTLEAFIVSSKLLLLMQFQKITFTKFIYVNSNQCILCLFYQLFIWNVIVCLDHDYLSLANFQYKVSPEDCYEWQGNIRKEHFTLNL